MVFPPAPADFPLRCNSERAFGHVDTRLAARLLTFQQQAAFACGFNRSVQHIVRIVVPGCHSLAFFLVERSVDSPPRQAGLVSSPTDRAPSGKYCLSSPLV